MIEVGDFIDGNYEGKTTRELIELISELKAQLERATDLVRWNRHVLFDEGLISDEEFAALVADSDNGQRVTRLEGYDKTRKDLAEVKKAATALVEAMDRCKPDIDGAFVFQAVHGSNYTGPTYGAELEALRTITAPTEKRNEP